MDIRHEPTFSNVAWLEELSDEEKIRLEANLRAVYETMGRIPRIFDVPIPPSFEEMKFDGDRGL
jgi:hypothetical protein